MANNSNKSSGKMAHPEAKDAMNRFKEEVASEIGVNLKQGYNGDITAKEAGSIGGEMVRKMIKSQEQQMSGNNNQ
ncbi:MAG: alpha/beta-type small acid-soluble spore protein [Lachnospiraceae bacterium]|nr:alpha/beta-type small acid-soluble spore protein [Lachnospiraceae bacterium]